MSKEFEVGQRVSYPNKVHQGLIMYAKVVKIASWLDDGDQVVFIEREDIPGAESSYFCSRDLTLEPSESQLEAERLMDEEAMEWNGSLVTEGGMYGHCDDY